jgi:hypothetical protein
VADEQPSNGHLARRLDRIEDLLVSRNELTLSLEHLQSQIRDLKDDIKALHTERAAKGSANRAAFLACVGGILGALVVAAVLAWVTGKGGH